MTQENPVPRLDLAPKLKRPLSLWNPLDYLRLLYWVFYFPQALRWYVDTFGGGYIPLSKEETNWRKGLELMGRNTAKGLELLRQNTVQRNLFLQGLVLTVVTPLVLSGILQSIDVSIEWREVMGGIYFGIFFGVFSGVSSGLIGMAGVVALSVVIGVTYAVTGGVMGSVAAYGVMAPGVAGVQRGLIAGVNIGVTRSVAVISGMVLGMLPIIGLNMALGGITVVALGMTGVALVVMLLRPESWLIGLSFNIQYLEKGSLLFFTCYSTTPTLSFCGLKKMAATRLGKQVYIMLISCLLTPYNSFLLLKQLIEHLVKYQPNKLFGIFLN